MEDRIIIRNIANALIIPHIGRFGSGDGMAKYFGGSENDGAYSASGIRTDDGGFIMAKETWSDDGDVTGNHGDGDFWIVKSR